MELSTFTQVLFKLKYEILSDSFSYFSDSEYYNEPFQTQRSIDPTLTQIQSAHTKVTLLCTRKNRPVPLSHVMQKHLIVTEKQRLSLCVTICS